MDEIKKDKRFAHVTKDPRFRKMKRKDKKVKIDKRFQAMFNDKTFKMKYQVDKRGRPIQATTNEDLRRFYDLDNSDNEEEEGDGEDKVIQSKQSEEEKKIKGDKEETGVESEDDESEDDEEEKEIGKEKPESDEAESGDSEQSDSDNEIDIKDGPDYARGEGLESSSSDDDGDDEEEDDESGIEEEIEHRWGELDKDVSEAPEATHRLAVCNMDWDRIKAQDLLLLLNSFKPTGGFIRSVTIYPSDFGLERMKKEEVKGPTELVEHKKPKDNSETTENETEYHQERLRQYQLNRLRYYYAVAEFDSLKTANAVYEECDGIEYESSATRMDLRFIPNDMTFDDREPTSVATDVPANTKYEPSTFITSALQQSKVRLTWDETNHDRVKVTQKKFDKDEVDDMDLKDYLASDSGEEHDPYGVIEHEFGEASSEDEDEDQKINKYKQLLQGLSKEDNKDDKEGEMEITWDPDLDTKLGKKKKQENLTPWEDYLDKKKEKRKKKKEIRKEKAKEEEVEAEGTDEDSNGIPSDVDMDDEYFRTEIEAQRKTDEKLKKKKQKGKKGKKENTAENDEEEARKGADLELLLMDKDDDERKHFNLKDIQEREQSKGKKRKRMKKKNKEVKTETEDSFKIDVGDNRFNAVFDNPLYNIDPSAAAYKKTNAMEEIIHEKIKRHKTDGLPKNYKHTGIKPSENKDKLNVVGDAKKDPSLASLVKSVKAKTKSIQEKKHSLKSKQKH